MRRARERHFGNFIVADFTENLLNTQEVYLLHEVLCEMVYVLDGVYKTSRKDINNQLSACFIFINKLPAFFQKLVSRCHYLLQPQSDLLIKEPL